MKKENLKEAKLLLDLQERLDSINIEKKNKKKYKAVISIHHFQSKNENSLQRNYLKFDVNSNGKVICSDNVEEFLDIERMAPIMEIAEMNFSAMVEDAQKKIDKRIEDIK